MSAARYARATPSPNFCASNCSEAFARAHSWAAINAISCFISGRLLGGVVGGSAFAAEFGRQVLPGKRCEDAVLDPRWEILWPLVDSLVGHADGGGGGGGSAAQQFNGF